MEEDNIKKSKTCPFCGTSLISNACPECNILIEEDDYKIELKKENKKEEEEEEYDWREHKR